MKSDVICAPAIALGDVALEAKTWLIHTVAPLWSSVGRTTSGLFAERMTLNGEPDDSYFRTFVQARHIFSFVTIGELGWRGPWRALTEETVGALLKGARRTDGLFVHRLDNEARPVDERADLYDQAFVLFALGTAGRALDREDCFDESEALLDIMESKWKHPAGGFREGELVDDRIRRQNPHMHLLEAFLALYDGSGRDRFRTAAISIAELALARFVDPSSGALLEYFTDTLQPANGAEGHIAEPGHCCEWAWLFERLAEMGWERGSELSDRLTAFARARGVDPDRGVMINAVLTDGTIHDSAARLWPQTERMKSAVARYRRLQSEVELREIVAAATGLRRYFEVPIAGLWRDKLRSDGGWVDEMAPGSSLYHICCAYSELIELRHSNMQPLRKQG